MDDTTSTSASSSTSDSDSYNTESARLYFGPVKTPERKFVANNRRLLPLQVPHSLRRSPRLSSPRPQPPTALSTVDQESDAQETREIDLVAELVNGVGVEDDEQMPYPPLGTPERVEELELDEPLSALADKILHAVDNPSPPPSPATALKMFDPYHPANLTDSGEYEGDLLFPHVTQGPTAEDSYPLIIFPESSNASTSEAAMNQDLIVFDSPNQLPSFSQVQPIHVSQQPMSVDDLLANSPDASPLYQQSLDHAPKVFIDEPTSGGVGGDLMSIDSPPKSQEEGRHAFDHSSETQDPHIHDKSPYIFPNRPAIADDVNVTPLRRSTRPRKSVAPTPSPQPPPVVVAPPSVARTSVKRKDCLRNLDEDIVDNPKDDQDDDRRSPSRQLPSTPRSRHRSPSKEPFSFHREVGSLSPTSASVLSSLAFNSGQIMDSSSSPSRSRSTEPPTVLSFSVFASSGGTSDDLSTPVRTDGPKRVPSPQKIEVSPRKFRLQSPAPNGTANTPARRIPIEQAIAEGQLSPEKAAKMGFKPSSATSVVSTPARRIQISEKPAILGPKSAVPVLESPAKQLATHKELLGVFHRHTTPTLKGKERAISPAPQGASSSVVKPALPFPIVATISVESQAPVAVQNLPKPGSSPAKSTLKVTSKIPRINRKPYARKVPEKFASPTGFTRRRPTDLAKSASLPSANSSTTKRPIRLAETANVSANPLSRPKPTVSTTSTSTVLKRKREDNPSPSKPRPTVLRQVPSLTSRQLPAGSKTQTTGNEPALPPDQDTIWVRRVAPPPEHPVPEARHEDPTIYDHRFQSEAAVPSSPLEGSDLPPASPMKQDLDVQQPYSIVESSPPVSESGTSGLRRTTRPRRSINTSNSNHGTVPRKTTRRKPVTHLFDDVFSGMSITALKELTMTNTEKNQQYLAAKLETEVVRKEGLRPESPAVKIRTIVQRQQEDQERQRTERAKRRARRSGSDAGFTSDIEASSDVGYSSPAEHIEDMDMDTNFNVGGLPKHRRGAGDDEDYETPERPLRDVRVRLFNDESGDREPDRRVKWDRGLFSLVYLDEVELGSRQNLKENRALKSILAPAAKAVRLDTLGNLLHADTPLSDLIPENVTVKKFVYDNDAAEPPPPKTTRSKSKRK